MNLSETSKTLEPSKYLVAFYHDIEQNCDHEANVETCRYVLQEYLKLEKKYDIPVTYNVVGKFFSEQPDLIDWIIKSGQEIAFHSYSHQVVSKSESYINEIDLCRKISSIPCGYRSPRSLCSDASMKHLWEKGFLWNAEADARKEPYFLYEGLVRIPIINDDYSLYTGVMSNDEWIQQFSRLFQTRTFITYGSHDVYTSYDPEERLKAWETILKIAKEKKALFVNFSEAADLYRRAALSRHYSMNATNWNQATKPLYRTKRFQELIRNEVKKLNRPIIADLGSGGGILSVPLEDLAEKIYCIDNAPNMIKEFNNNQCIQSYLGEVTDTNLQDNSIDFIICARIIEYLPWPERLADEIKRIGKHGAIFFVTFPAARDTPHPINKSPPDRLRHYFTSEEIIKWAKQIGKGKLIGVQYKYSEPNTSEEEQQYREMENNPDPKSTPSNWVYIGNIQEKYTKPHYRKSVPSSAFNFQFSEQGSDLLKITLLQIGRRLPKPVQKLGIRLFIR